MAEDWEMRRLEFHEGCRLMPYRCPAGKLTIGIGRCIDTNPFTKEELQAVGDWKHGITKNAALMLLRNDIDRCKNELSGLDFYAKLDLERKYALLDMCFCQGIHGVLKYKKMLSAMRIKDWEKAYKECLNSRWHLQAKSRCERIANTIKTGVFEK